MFEHKDSLRLNTLLVLALVGIVVASYLSWVSLGAEREAVCGPVGDCHAVQNSQYADVVGIPVALLGTAMYGTLLLLIVVRRWRVVGGPVTGVWMFALALGGMVYSFYLTYLELFVIEAVCLWCVVSAVVVTLFFILTVPELRKAGKSR